MLRIYPQPRAPRPVEGLRSATRAKAGAPARRRAPDARVREPLGILASLVDGIPTRARTHAGVAPAEALSPARRSAENEFVSESRARLHAQTRGGRRQDPK